MSVLFASCSQIYWTKPKGTRTVYPLNSAIHGFTLYQWSNYMSGWVLNVRRIEATLDCPLRPMTEFSVGGSLRIFHVETYWKVSIRLIRTLDECCSTRWRAIFTARRVKHTVTIGMWPYCVIALINRINRHSRYQIARWRTYLSWQLSWTLLYCLGRNPTFLAVAWKWY